MSTFVTTPVADPFRRFASGFGRAATVLSVVGLLVAVAMTVSPSWFDMGRSEAPSSGYTDLRPGEPVRVSIGGVGLVSPLLASDRAPQTTLTQPPTDVPLVSWWRDGAKPGATVGQTVLTAHADGATGALASMAASKVGDFVDLLTKTGTMRYEITGVHTLDPQRMEKAAIGYFKQGGGGGRLVMVSAQGWDGAAYQQTVVVTAMPLGEPTDP